MNESLLIEIEGTPYSYDNRICNLITRLDDRVKNLRARGQLTPEALERIRKFFRIKNIHHSNAIEGNRLDYGETRLVVEEGLTITGKPLKDTLEAKNLAHAIDFFEDLAKKTEISITEFNIREVHQAILNGINDKDAGIYRMSEVEISGSAYKPPTYIQVPDMMNDYASWLSKVSNPETRPANISPIILACVAHTWFVYIHPFVDGNGRTARILMNLVLMRAGYPISVITKPDRGRYYDALEISQTSDLTPFIALICDSLGESLDEYETAVQDQMDKIEWARSLFDKVKEQEISRLKVQFEIWYNAMELLKNYFNQMVSSLNDASDDLVKIYFTGFDVIDFEKYMTARKGANIKRTWFFRIDFLAGDRSARYMFFFGLPSFALRNAGASDVSLFISREEHPFYYEKLDQINNEIAKPSIREIGYSPTDESFVCRYQDKVEIQKVEQIGRVFFSEVMHIHFS